MKGIETYEETSQELRMLSSVTLDCQVTKIVMNSGSQLSALYLVSQMSQHRKGFFGQVRSPHHAELSLLLLSIIVTILQKILEESRVTLKCQNQKVTE